MLEISDKQIINIGQMNNQIIENVGHAGNVIQKQLATGNIRQMNNQIVENVGQHGNGI